MSARSTTFERTRRAAHAVATTLTAALLLAPASMLAQGPSRPLTDRIMLGGHLQVSEPRGDFGQNTGNGFGVGGTGVVRIDPAGALAWRLDVGFLTYGNESCLLYTSDAADE